MKILPRLVSLLFPYGRETAPRARDAAQREDYRRLFSSALGQKVLADILNEGGLFRAHARGFDERSLFMLEGRRWLALDIFDKAGGARARLGIAMTRDNAGEALYVRNLDSGDDNRGARRLADDPGEDGDPLFPAAADDPTVAVDRD